MSIPEDIGFYHIQASFSSFLNKAWPHLYIIHMQNMKTSNFDAENFSAIYRKKKKQL